MYSLEDDNRLVHMILEGDPDEYRILIKRYKRLVSNIVAGLVYNREDREEIGQEIFVKIYKNLSTFQFRSKLSTWIAKIAYNTCLKFLRKKKVPLYEDIAQDKKQDVDQAVLRIDNAVSNEIPPDKDIENSQTLEFVSAEINSLPVQYRAAVTFFHLENMSLQEISRITGQPEGTVKSHLFRARKIIKDRLLEKFKREELCL
ncbi:MAG: sigma-70 family RNA polymerase sigma factor [bacterium]|nr:sigma-70 family RNA polymerase sigma factor [bacterium]